MRIIKIKEVIHFTGLGRSTIYRYIAEGKFPNQVALSGGRACGWVEQEIQDWILSRVAERDTQVDKSAM